MNGSGGSSSSSGRGGGGRIFFLQAGSSADLERWMYAVAQALLRHKGGARQGAGADRRRTEEEEAFIVGRHRVTGILKKKGKINTAWQSRFFILEKGVLSYYEHEIGFAKGHHPKGRIPSLPPPSIS
jgi:hypothetical protein